jgi:hypothetical protein
MKPIQNQIFVGIMASERYPSALDPAGSGRGNGEDSGCRERSRSG